MARKQSDNSVPNPSFSRDEPQLGGLILVGTVIDRTRRMVPRDNPTTMIVTYTLDDGMGRRYLVDDYAPADFFDVGMYITVPVYVKVYMKRNKELAYTLNIQKEFVSDKGEHF